MKTAIVDECAGDLCRIFKRAGWEVIFPTTVSVDDELADQARSVGAVLITYDKHLPMIWKDRPYRLVWLGGVANKQKCRRHGKFALAAAKVLLCHEAAMVRVYKRSLRLYLPNGGQPVQLPASIP